MSACALAHARVDSATVRVWHSSFSLAICYRVSSCNISAPVRTVLLSLAMYSILLEVNHSQVVDSPGVYHTHRTHHFRGLPAKHPGGNGKGVDANVQQTPSAQLGVIQPLCLLRHFADEVTMEMMHFAYFATLYQTPHPEHVQLLSPCPCKKTADYSCRHQASLQNQNTARLQ